MPDGKGKVGGRNNNDNGNESDCEAATCKNGQNPTRHNSMKTSDVDPTIIILVFSSKKLFHAVAAVAVSGKIAAAAAAADTVSNADSKIEDFFCSSGDKAR